MISAEYRELNKQLHGAGVEYGAHGYKFAPLVERVIKGFRSHDILDYGCGQRTLERKLGFPIKNYDPAIEGCDQPPEPADIVVCTDVAEHIEPEYLDAVLDDLKRVTKKVLLMTIASRPAKKHLADGRNAHLIIEDYRWWMPKLWARFNILEFNNLGNKEYLLLLEPEDA